MVTYPYASGDLDGVTPTETITYTYGNPTTYRGATLTWNGRRLTSYNGASYWYVTNIQGDVMYVADFTLNLSIGFESIGMFGSITDSSTTTHYSDIRIGS